MQTGQPIAEWKCPTEIGLQPCCVGEKRYEQVHSCDRRGRLFEPEMKGNYFMHKLSSSPISRLPAKCGEWTPN